MPAGAKTNSFEEEVLKLLFQNSNIPNIGDATGLRGSTSAGNLHIALFTANPGESGSAANEANYTGYARQSVARSAGGWAYSTNSDQRLISNNAAITFPVATGGSNTITHAAICKGGTAGVGDIIIYAPLSLSLAVSTGVQPQIPAGSFVIEEQ